MKATPATLAAAVVLVGACGFLAGRMTGSPDSARSEADAAETANRPMGRGAGAAGGAGADRPGRPGVAGDSRTERRLSNLTQVESVVLSENALERSRAMLAMIDRLAPEDFEQAVAQFRAMGLTDQRNGEYAMLLSAWAEVDPLAAIEYAQENTGGNFASQTILSAWASRDPDAAIRWADTTHTGDGPNPLMIGVIRGIAETDPNRATQLLTAMPRSNQRGEALAGMLPHILKDGPDAARNWIGAITDDSLRNGAMERAAVSMAQTDPRGTADWLISNPGQAADRRMNDVLRSWASQDETAALNYYQSLPSGDSRSNALRGIVDHVARNDPQAAAALIERNAGDVNDPLIRNFAWRTFRQDPSLAASYIGRIENEGQRDDLYRRTFDNWLRTDMDSALNFIGSTELPEGVQRHVRRRIEQELRRE